MQVLLFVKYPHPGQVKTRLAADIGAENAAALYRAFVHDELAMLAAIGVRPRICCAPNADLSMFGQWLGAGYHYALQVGADLGERMRHALGQTLDLHPSALLLGSDVPDLPANIIRHAEEGLRKSSVCLGPAEDGGYYAVGLSSDQPLEWLFSDIPWSTPQVLDVTCARCASRDLRPYLLPQWADVDTMADVSRVVVRTSWALETVRQCQRLLPQLFGG